MLSITMSLGTGLWAAYRAGLLICDLATISQVLHVIFNDVDSTEEGRMGLVLFGVFKIFIWGV